jgi:hypothetical protein
MDDYQQLLNSIQATLQKIQQTIESIRKRAEAQDNEQPTRIQVGGQIEPRLPVEIVEYYRAEERERPRKNRTERSRLNVERGGMAIAFVIALFTLITLIVFQGQLKEMQKQTADAAYDQVAARRHAREEIRILSDQVGVMQRQMRQDQRAWLNVTFGNVNTFALNQPLTVPVTVIDTGKTAAKRYVAHFVVKRVTNTRAAGEALSFSLAIPHIVDTSGFMLPNAPITEAVTESEHAADGKTIIPHPLSPKEFEDVRDGVEFGVVFVDATYDDIFGVSHWIRACHYFAPAGIPTWAKKCTDYNDVDNN